MLLLRKDQKGFKVIGAYLSMRLWKPDRPGLSGSAESETIWGKDLSTGDGSLTQLVA